MNAERFHSITTGYPKLRIGVVGDFFLDRYLLIDPSKEETSIETGLPVYNVVDVRSQAGAAGTIVNNLVALGIGEIYPVGFRGDDGEGYELHAALAALSGVNLEHFLTSPARRTPVYCKPLVLEAGLPPRELNRFDSKNWTPTPETLQAELESRLTDLASRLDVLLLLDQVDLEETGVVTKRVRNAARAVSIAHKNLLVLADSRRGLGDYPPLAFKMNAAELARMTGEALAAQDAIMQRAAELAARNGSPVFVTLAEGGIVGALPGTPPCHVPAFPIRGPLDIVGAGDAVTSNLVAALASGASLQEAMELAMAAASIVIHQLGTTGTASVAQIGDLLQIDRPR